MAFQRSDDETLDDLCCMFYKYGELLDENGQVPAGSSVNRYTGEDAVLCQMGRGTLVTDLNNPDIPSELSMIIGNGHTPYESENLIDASSAIPFYPIRTNWCFSSGATRTLFATAIMAGLVAYL